MRPPPGLLAVVTAMLASACNPAPSGTPEGGVRELARTAVHQALEGGAFEALRDQAIAAAFGAAKSRIEGSGKQLTVAQVQQLETAIRTVFVEIYPREAWEEALVPIYLGHFDQRELAEVVRFQATDLGQKLSVAQAQLATGGGGIGQQLIQSRQADFVRRLTEQLAAVWGPGGKK